MKCALYPCFDITCGKIEREEEAVWVCCGCKEFGGDAGKKMKIIDKFFLKAAGRRKFADPDAEKARSAINTLKNLGGLGNDFVVLTASKKKEAFEIESRSGLSNIGVFSCLSRNVAIGFSHSSAFRPPPLLEVLLAESGQIIGEQTNAGKKFYMKGGAEEIVLPPVPFPEIKGKNVCSSSPSPALDAWLRKKINVKEGDATLLLGFDVE